MHTTYLNITSKFELGTTHKSGPKNWFTADYATGQVKIYFIIIFYLLDILRTITFTW